MTETINVGPRSRGSNTAKRYLRFMHVLHNSGAFRLSGAISQGKVNSGLGTELMERKLIEHIGKGEYLWKGDEPTLELATEIHQHLTQKMKQQKKKRELKQTGDLKVERPLTGKIQWNQPEQIALTQSILSEETKLQLAAYLCRECRVPVDRTVQHIRNIEEIISRQIKTT